jgi:hypothetical protein
MNLSERTCEVIIFKVSCDLAVDLGVKMTFIWPSYNSFLSKIKTRLKKSPFLIFC